MAEYEQTTAIAKIQAAPVAVRSPWDNWLDPTRFNQIQRAAQVFSKSDIVPAHYRGKAENCIIAINAAYTLGLDPLMMLQKSYIVNGKPGLEATVVIALVNERGPFADPISWRFTGKPLTDEWTCTAFAHLRSNGEERSFSLTWANVKKEGWLDKSGSKWKTLPELMFQYRTGAMFGRLYCPGVILGMLTVEELRDIETQDSPRKPKKADLTVLPDATVDAEEIPMGSAPNGLRVEPDSPSSAGMDAYNDPPLPDFLQDDAQPPAAAVPQTKTDAEKQAELTTIFLAIVKAGYSVGSGDDGNPTLIRLAEGRDEPDVEIAKHACLALSSFVGKDGTRVEGKLSRQLSAKRLDVTLGKAKKIYDQIPEADRAA